MRERAAAERSIFAALNLTYHCHEGLAMEHPRGRRIASLFAAALVLDTVGLGLLSAILLFAWLSARHLNLLVSLWLTANVFILGGLVCLLALWVTRIAVATASGR